MPAGRSARCLVHNQPYTNRGRSRRGKSKCDGGLPIGRVTSSLFRSEPLEPNFSGSYALEGDQMRTLLTAILLLLFGLGPYTTARGQEAVVQVYKSPT